MQNKLNTDYPKESTQSTGRTMRAAVLNRVQIPGKLDIQEVQTDQVGPNEVLVRLAACGLCHSDLNYLEGRQKIQTPAILGHEAAGIVEEVGEQVTSVKVGDHVLACQVYCGRCEPCLSGNPILCNNRQAFQRPTNERQRLLTLEGSPIAQFSNKAAFAELMLTHEKTLVTIRPEMPLDRAGLLGCGVTTGLGAVLNTAKVVAGSTVAVIGCGGVGLSAVQGARIAGAAQIIAVDAKSSKLERAKQFGATDVVDASKVDSVKAVKNITEFGVHYSFEAVGNSRAAEQAVRMLRKRGIATLMGTIPEDQRIELTDEDLRGEKKVQTSTLGSVRFPIDIPRYVDLYLQGHLKLDELISQRISLDEINKGFSDMKAGEVIRSVVMFE